ncbi:hypothetical protein DE146DRAFT_335753 [Phaeosphaeria sp. MPI-PUGE-AT-0046c]|nr:hypothetical protein DE146DRAFT_335753 [Phaeosphaeria sp. MPI-PUGE-AT-0046c]
MLAVCLHRLPGRCSLVLVVSPAIPNLLLSCLCPSSARYLNRWPPVAGADPKCICTDPLEWHENRVCWMESSTHLFTRVCALHERGRYWCSLADVGAPPSPRYLLTVRPWSTGRLLSISKKADAQPKDSTAIGMCVGGGCAVDTRRRAIQIRPRQATRRRNDVAARLAKKEP